MEPSRRVLTTASPSAGLDFQIEDQVTGQFAFIAYTHPAVWEFHYLDENREELQNREGQPYVAIHLWPGDNRVAKKVILPYVADYDERLRAERSSPEQDSSVRIPSLSAR